MDYLALLQTTWHYFPYFFYVFVFLTLIPKSLAKINSFAAANYAANCKKYHRCYSPEACCHHATPNQVAPKPKPRRAVTRVYPKKQTSTEHEPPQRRPLVAPILSQNHVNEIARMFESGTASRKINRVPPTILPEIRMNSFDLENALQHNNKKYASSTHHEQLLENIENSANLLNREMPTEELDANWRSEPITMAPQKRQRAVPTTLSFSDGASATPSSGSPAAGESDGEPISGSPLDFSPTLRRMPLNMKSSLEDIFAAIARNAENNECNLKFAGCSTLSPVTSIEDILSQRRLSRPLSAYSISDLLNEESNQGMDEAFVENFLRTLNKT